jgi:hypothetical protein
MKEETSEDYRARKLITFLIAAFFEEKNDEKV